MTQENGSVTWTGFDPGSSFLKLPVRLDQNQYLCTEYKPMIDKTQIIPVLMQRLQALPCGHYLDVRTYKRNRYVLFVRKGENDYLIIENGYFKQRFENVPLDKIKKLLKTLLKKEFPRSTKIRVYSMGQYDEESADSTKRKVL